MTAWRFRTGIEAELETFKDVATRRLTLGVSTYVAARWLSPRLMSFMQEQPEFQLRIQPVIRFLDRELS
jgi:DNA-binding transcriptional LysR family regulator